MSGLYNNNSNPIPGNGADVFGDKLVGNQFVDGTSQFTLGNFGITSNFTQKNSRDFSLGNFSEPINLETLQITDISESKLLASNKLEVFIKFDRSKVSNYTLYGSLRERLKVAVQQVIRKFPASMKFDQFRTWADFLSGETATNITFNPSTNETNLNLNLYTLFNPFGLEFTQASLIPTGDEFNELRNLLFSFKKYSLYLNNVQYPLSFIQATSGNTNLGSLNIKVIGNPFSGQSSTVDTFHIKPNTLAIEESFDSLEDIEKFLVERKSNPIYTAKFQQPQEGANGVIVKGKTFITWPSTEDGNIIISGSLFDAYLSQLFDVADTFDSYKTNLVSRFLTTAAFKEFDTYDEKVDKILKIYGRSFDDVKKYIDGLAYMTNVTYDSQNNVPNELLKNLAQTLGWGTPSAIKNEGFLDTLFNRNENPEYPSQGVSPTPSELDFELYRRLLVNTAYLFKSKGTRRGIEFMLRFVGAPEALIEFNEHVYVAGQPMNMQKFKEFELKISGGTYTEEQPVLQTYFSAATNSFPPIIVTGFSQGYETITKNTTVNPSALPVDKDGYPTIPKYGPNAYFQAGAGWFEETTEHTGKEVVDYTTSVFTGNTPFIKTKLNKFTYGEPYLQLYRKFPDSKLGFPIVRTVDNKKSWVKKDNNDFRYLNLADRGTNYQTKNDKLVINVKNVDVFLNVGQGLEWDVWNHSRRYSCPFGPNALSSPYPGYGGPDWTEILADATKLSFFEFAQKFWTVLINVKNRQTIDDGHAGGYPTLLSIYLDYINSDQTCGIPSNKYTYEKMIEYVENMGDYWIRLLEQLIPATTIWQGGVKYENSIFHRYKYAYKHGPLCDDLECFGSFVNCCYPISNDVLVNAFLDCGGLEFSGATWHNKITLGGVEYTGNTYYSSTTLYDIPSTQEWMQDMTYILSGITQDSTDSNSGLTYYQINDSVEPNMTSIREPNCIVIQGPCENGKDIWNYNNGSDAHTFKTEICLNIETNQVSPTPDKDIWVFYLFQDLGASQTNAAKVAIDNWVNSLGTSYTGNVYHLPVKNNRWLSWASLPKSGGTISIGTGTYFTNNGFTLPPGSGGSNYTIDPNVSDDVLMIGLIPDSRKSYNGQQDLNSCGYRTPQNDISDWSYGTNQPTSTYQTDFTEFSNTFNNYNTFQAFIYPVITGKPLPQSTLTFPLHLYGALTTSTVSPADLVENPTVTALGGSLAAITFSNPYTALTANNLSTGYSGPGLENFGFGTSYDAGTNICGGLTCNDLGFNVSCVSTPPYGTFDPSYFYTNGIFQSQLAQFLGPSAETTSNVCEICIPICYNDEFIDVNLYDSSVQYNYNDKVLDSQGNVYVWKGNDNSFTGLPSVDSEWVLLGPVDAIPFLGGNNFTEGEDCDNFDEVIEPLEVTGTTITTNPELFKDGIFNVGAQDCFVSTYSPCEELVDPCACDVTYGMFDVSSTLFELGDVVCCPGIPSEGITERKWVRTDNFGVCRDVALFIPSLCGEEPTIPKCWSLCDDETSGENRTTGGKWSKEQLYRPNKVPSLIVNDFVDPCDPEEPTEPTNRCLDCGDGDVKSMLLSLDFYDITPNQVPPKVLQFAMNEDQLGEIATSSFQLPGNKKPFKKARINLCCLADKLVHYFRVYNRLGPVPSNPQEISYGHVEVNYDIEQNTIIEFYYQPGVFGLGGDGDVIDKLFMYVPPSTNQIQSTPVNIVDNPSVGNFLSTQFTEFASFFTSLNEICIQIGRKNSQQQLSFFKLRKYPDSMYLTDNGTGTGNVEFNDIFDRYWAFSKTGGMGQGLYGAIESKEIIKVVGSTQPDWALLRNSNFRYNWEMRMSCKGKEYQDINFVPNMVDNSALYTNGDVPFSMGCGTDMRTPIVNQNESSNRVPVRVSDLATKGNTFNVPVEKAMEETGVNKDNLKNYEVRSSEMYIISNTNPLRQSRNIEYNSPVTITNTNGPTSETFIENNRKRIKLGWLDKVAKGSDNNLIIEFVSTENQSRFSQDIKQKSVGNGVLTLPNEEELPSSRNRREEDNVSFYNSTDNRSLDIIVNDPDEPTSRQYVTYTDLRDWAINSVGEIKDLSNKQILYTSGGLVQGFQIGPTYTTNVANSQYISGIVPIGDVETEFLISTLGSFDDYVRNQTGSTSSGLTISLSGINTNYSGYTNLSGYTDNQEQNISPDFVFDISLKGSSMSLGSNIAMSDPIMGEFRLIGDDRELHPSIPLPLVDREPVLFNLTRQEVSEGGEYFYYKIPKTQNYRLQYKSHLKLEYFDEGWCEYLNVYRNLTENTFPNNDYEFKQLINSSILYNGGFASAPVEYQEGNIANNYTQPYGYLTPVFGYSPNQGFGNFNTTVYIEKISSGTTSATTLGKYTVASNPTTTPSANETLILPYNDSDKFTDLYQCTGTTGTTAIFTKECNLYIDTGCVTLNEGDEVRLKVEINWDSTTKAFSGSTTGTSVNLTLGSDYTTTPESRPWFRVINKECNVTTSNNYLYWQPNEDSVLTESFIDGKNIPPSPNDNKGKLILLNSIEEETNYLIPKVNKNNLNDLTYLDIPAEKNYKGPLKLIPTAEKTNNWVKAIEEGRITDYRINDVKLLNINKGSEVKWNIPVNVNNKVESISLDDSSHTFVVQSTVGVKGTDKSFDIINSLEPNITTESIKEPSNESETLLDRGTISYISSRPLEDRTIDFRENHTIIRDKVIIVESGVYDKDTPTPTPSRGEYCKCGKNTYLEVPKTSNYPCSKWCCATDYNGTEYYGCKGKTPAQWIDGLYRDTNISTRPLIITEGKPPGVIRF